MQEDISLNGFLAVNKPLGATSSNVVVRIRRMLPKGTAVGHGGTLDPQAEGVLPVCVGPATRLFDYIIDKEKTYETALRLGEITDTQDASGQIIERRDVRATEADVRAILPRFVGRIEQVPPMYSAIKRDGRRLYELARKGVTVDVQPRACDVFSIEYLRQLDDATHSLRVTCGKGVYIRTLCHDIGQALGCGAHMLSLVRTRAGIFRIEASHTPEALEALAREARLQDALLPPDAPLAHLPMAQVGADKLRAVLNGNVLRPQWMLSALQPAGTAVRVYCGAEFAGIGEVQEDGSVRFRAMLLRR